MRDLTLSFSLPFFKAAFTDHLHASPPQCTEPEFPFLLRLPSMFEGGFAVLFCLLLLVCLAGRLLNQCQPRFPALVSSIVFAALPLTRPGSPFHFLTNLVLDMLAPVFLPFPALRARCSFSRSLFSFDRFFQSLTYPERMFHFLRFVVKVFFPSSELIDDLRLQASSVSCHPVFFSRFRAH